MACTFAPVGGGTTFVLGGEELLPPHPTANIDATTKTTNPNPLALFALSILPERSFIIRFVIMRFVIGLSPR
jgi:hypothetical protein